MLRNKSEAFQTFCNFKSQVELQLGHKIRAIQSDWSGEYRVFSNYLKGNGIHHQISCPGAHEQNGTVERKHRHIVETELTLLAQASMPYEYWDEAFRTSVYLINRLPTPTLPMEILFGTPPHYSSLKVFGYVCFPNTRFSNQHKLEFRSLECTFLGYSLNHKGFKCLDPTGKIIISRNVIFDETSFPFSKMKDINNPHTSSDITEGTQYSSLIIPSSSPKGTETPVQQNHSELHRVPQASNSPHEQEQGLSPTDETPTDHPTIPTNKHNMQTRSKFGIYKPKAFLVNKEPTSIHEALHHEHWKAAMRDELLALQSNGTWSLVPLPTNRRAIGCKWVFKVKENYDGTIYKHKARLVAKGFHQTVGFDFIETFSLVVKPTTVRVILSIALTKRWTIHQLDINNAFLNGELKEEVNM